MAKETEMMGKKEEEVVVATPYLAGSQPGGKFLEVLATWQTP